MRNHLFIAARSFVAMWLVVLPHLANAGAIKGRVVDSADQPVAGAEIRIWRKTKAQNGTMRNEPVTFNDAETLRTDNAGRFVTSDVFDAAVPVRVVAQAEGMLADRSGWFLPERDMTHVEDIVLRRLQSIEGQVVDSQGTPVPGATVFNSGEGHVRVETKTDAAGRFKLDGVPDNARFVFAEKRGYRFTGMIRRPDKPNRIALVHEGESVTPPEAETPQVSDTECAELASKLLEPYLQAVLERGSEAERAACQYDLAQINSQRALDLAKSFAGADGKQLDNARLTAILAWIDRRPDDDWDEIAALIASQEDHWNATRLYLGGVDAMPAAQRDRKHEWIAEAVAHARQIVDPVPRAYFLAWIADDLFKLGEPDCAATLLVEAETLTEQLPRENWDAIHAFERLAAARCKSGDTASSLIWLDRIGHAGRYGYACGSIAAELAADRPADAEKVWIHVEARNDPRAMAGRSLWLPQFFFRLARSDVARARRLAEGVSDAAWRMRAWGTMSRGLAEKDEATARSLLIKAVAEEGEAGHLRGESIPLEVTPATTLLWLLPIARHVAPDMMTELVWRALSLRRPRPVTGTLDDEVEQGDAALAKLLAPWNREAARNVVAPLASRLPALTHRPSDGLEVWYLQQVLTAAALVDPRWAVEICDSLPGSPDLASNRPQNQARMWLARFLSYSYKRRLEFLNYLDPE